MEAEEIIPGKIQQHAPSPENPRPLPSQGQIYEKVYIDFGRGQKVAGTIHSVKFYDPALYYEVLIRIVNVEYPDGSFDERYVYIDVPAGIVFKAEPANEPS